jgi:hypothetical protein
MPALSDWQNDAWLAVNWCSRRVGAALRMQEEERIGKSAHTLLPIAHIQRSKKQTNLIRGPLRLVLRSNNMK